MSIEFKKPSLAEIESLIQKELKEKSIESLSRVKQGDIKVKSIYTQVEGSSTSIAQALPYRINFQYFHCNAIEKEAHNKKILHALDNGASGLILDLNNYEYKVSDYRILLKDVQPEYLHIEFLNIKDSSELDLFIKEQPMALNAKHIAWKDSVSFSTLVLIPDTHFLEHASKFIGSVDKNLNSSYIHIELSGDYFWDICKIRAFKILLFNLLKREGNTNHFILIGETPISNKSVDKEENNILKLTTESMAALIAGCEGVWIKPFDFETNKSNQFSQRISRNIYNLLSEEAYLECVDDPSHGSYYIENYTKQIAEKIYHNLD